VRGGAAIAQSAQVRAARGLDCIGAQAIDQDENNRH
jgi:hypothetical protein